MHSGNMGLSQHLDTLIDTASLLRPYEDLVVALVGDGTKRPSLEARAVFDAWADKPDKITY